MTFTASLTEPEPLTPVDLFLRAQQRLTAVERFAQSHDAAAVPGAARFYTDLLPAAPPRDGEQYAFEVDLDACSGCKACVTACHELNGLDDGETWRDVGLLHGGGRDDPVMQHVTSACHHCLDPACLNVCPVDAYEKHPATGIVKHLDDQCIGCQYCTLACPYDVPKYNRAKGIVRKCDLCSSRLAVGEAPACAQACPHGAIRVRVVDRQSVLDDSETNLFLPGAPEPQHTLPTTTYKTRRVFPRNMLPADYYTVHPEHAHWPLVWMLVLTQLSVGAMLLDVLLDAAYSGQTGRLRGVSAAGALLFGLLALAASTLHLGRPLYAFRAVLGLGHSWLSREIVAFGLYALLATVYAVLLWIAPRSSQAGALGGAVVLTGLAGVGCSVMIYHRTGRAFWNGWSAGLKFLATTLLLGAATVLAVSAWTVLVTEDAASRAAVSRRAPLLCQMLWVVAGIKLVGEAAVFRHLRDQQQTPLKRSARLMTGALARVTTARFAAGAIAGLGLPALLLWSDAFRPDHGLGDVTRAVLATILLIGLAAGEVLERYLFFTAVVAFRMPRGLTPGS